MSGSAEKLSPDNQSTEGHEVPQMLKEAAQAGADRETGGISTTELPNAIQREEAYREAGITETRATLGTLDAEGLESYINSQAGVAEKGRGESGIGISAEIPTEKGPIKIGVELGSGGYPELISNLIGLAKEQGLNLEPDNLEGVHFGVEQRTPEASGDTSESELDEAA